MVLFAALALGQIGVNPAPEVSLFNGRNLDGWYWDVPALDNDKSGKLPFVVRGGMLVSLGTPGGHLITRKQYADYRLTAEYRFAGAPGNCGILIHSSKLRRLYGMFPQSMEVQMQSGDAGDFWCIGEDVQVPNMVQRRGPKERWGTDGDKLRRIQNLTDGSERPVGQWNQMVIEARGRTIKVWVNGELVNAGDRMTASRGQIAIQAEGSEVEFRSLRLRSLKN